MSQRFFRRPATFCVVIALLVPAAVSATGLVVIDRPPPGWRPPPHAPHAFAPLELRRHHVTVSIAGQVATTEVEQTFFNPNDQLLEGTYLFPVPRGAKLDSFAMDIDGKLTEAELLDAAKARKIYEDIVRSLKDPALFEYAGQDLFKVRIFPLEPRKEKRVKLEYTQLLTADGGLVEYRLPLAPGKFSARPIESVSVTVRLAADEPLATIHSPSHAVEVKRDGDRKAVIGFEARDYRPDRDFQLIWGVEPTDDVGLGLLVHRAVGAEEGTFALFAAPVAVAVAPQPKDIVFVLDTSGSMADGDKLGRARRALEFCLRNLDDQDRFGLIRFATEAEALADRLLPADEASRERALAFVRGFKPIGGTAIAAALDRGLKLAAADHDAARPCFVVFLTDGLPTVGTTDVGKLVAAVARATEARSIRVFCFGVGTDVNTHLLDRIVETTRAASQYVLPEEDLELKLASFYGKIASPVLANLELAVEGPVRLANMHPAPLPDLFQGGQVVVLGRFTGTGRATLTLTGTVAGEPRRFTLTRSFLAGADEGCDFLPRLWAARRIGFLLDQIRLHGESRELRDEAAGLARQYGIVTPYTSWLILEDEGRRNVAASDRTLQALEADGVARAEARRMFTAAREAASGAGAVGDAQALDTLRRAESLAAPAAANARAWRGQAGMDGGGAAVQRAVESQQTRNVAGRTFYANAGQWIDARVQEQPEARRERITFGSGAYFALLDRDPAAAQWLALGRNVVVLVGDTIVEVEE